MRLPFRFAVAALLLIMATAMVWSMLLETQTWDEGIHLVAGYSYWKTGRFDLNQEHPPLFKLLATLPVLPLNPELPTKWPAWKMGDQIVLGDLFLYFNRVPADLMLQPARGVTVALTLALGLLMALWTRRKFGENAALLALALFALDPNLIAHGRYVTNDMLLALTAFAAAAAWGEYLEKRGRAWLAASGVLLGLAMVSKFSGFFLIPVFGLLWLLQAWQERAWSWRRFLSVFTVLGILAAAAISLVYAPETLRSIREGPRLEEIADQTTFIGQALAWVGRDAPIPAHPYLAGLNRMSHYAKQHSQYLLGQNAEHGWWYYFPVAFAVKTPVSILLLTLAGLGLAVAALFRGAILTRLRQAPLAWFVLSVPAVIYAAIVLNSPVNLGVRYLLPVYPLLFALLGAVVFHPGMKRRLRIAMLTAVPLLAAESLWTAPHYLAFFNFAAGGPAAGPRYLADSNIDWGQDVRHLKRYLGRIGWKQPVCSSYFGRARWDYYGIPYTGLRTEGPAANDCVAAVSVTNLLGVYDRADGLRWMRSLEPVARVGYSIYVYDLRRNKTPLRWDP